MINGDLPREFQGVRCLDAMSLEIWIAVHQKQANFKVISSEKMHNTNLGNVNHVDFKQTNIFCGDLSDVSATKNLWWTYQYIHWTVFPEILLSILIFRVKRLFLCTYILSTYCCLKWTPVRVSRPTCPLNLIYPGVLEARHPVCSLLYSESLLKSVLWNALVWIYTSHTVLYLQEGPNEVYRAKTTHNLTAEVSAYNFEIK